MPNTILIDSVIAPEGPVWDAENTLYLVEMGRKCLTAVEKDGSGAKIIATTRHRPNGLAMDGNGRLWVAEAYEGAIICFDANGKVLKRIEGEPGDPLLWPNDLAFGPNGLLYVTDSGIKEDDFLIDGAIRPDYAAVAFKGRVLEIAPSSGRVLRTIDSGLRFANGIAFGPDTRLYVNETMTGLVFRYDLGASGKREIFGNVVRSDLPPSLRGPDGMKFGADGRLYCTVFGQGDVTVLGLDGAVAERMPTLGNKPTNIAFSRAGGAFAAVTEIDGAAVEIMQTPCEGYPLFYPTFEI